jgi:hypothetical protein
MEQLAPGFEVSIDEGTGKVRAAYLRARDGAVAETREVAAGEAYADYDRGGRLLGVEFLAPCEVSVVDQLTLAEPENVREFLRSAPPRQMLLA